MRDRWLDEHVGGEAMVRPEFEASLGETLQTAWRQPSGSVAARRPTGPSRRTQVLIWAAAAAVLLVGGALVLTKTGKSAITSNTDDVRVPPTVLLVTTLPARTTVNRATTDVPPTSLPATSVAPTVVATSAEQQTVLDYMTALSDERYDDAAKLLGEGGLSLEDRSDLRPFLNIDGLIPDLAGSLKTWCAAALCQLPAALTSVDSRVVATFAVDGVERTTTFGAGTFEASPSVVGLPLQLPSGASLADTVHCPTEKVDDTAYADLDGDGWYETVTLMKTPDVGFLLFACGTTLDQPVFTVPLSEATAVGQPRVFPIDIEGDGTDELLIATFDLDGFTASVVTFSEGTLALLDRTVSISAAGRQSFGCVDLNGDGVRDLVEYTYSFVGGTDISNSGALDYTTSLDGIRTTGSLALPAQEVEAFRLIAGYCGNFATHTG